MKKTDKTYTFKNAYQSFSGYLVGTHKAEHTVKNYQMDLRSFERFMESLRKGTKLTELTKHDLERYAGFLKQEGLKPNSRRRKLLTARKFLGFLTQRGKVNLEIARRIPAPARHEKIPKVVPYKDLLAKIWAMPSARDTTQGDLDTRNKVLFWVLLETGAQVTEVAALRFENWDEKNGLLAITTKRARKIPVSAPLVQAVFALRGDRTDTERLFRGHNRHGASHLALTARGIELIVKELGPKLGYPDLVPRTLRHSAVLHWHQMGLDQKTMQERLGLQSDYAFRIYRALFEAHAKTLSAE